jgi:hypothetical protein
VPADGVGPLEAVEFERYEGRPDPAPTELADRHATTPRRTAREIVAETQAAFPAFSDDIDALCRRLGSDHSRLSASPRRRPGRDSR